MTPKLPEAHGPRSGYVGRGPDLRLAIIGDSAAAGVGVSLQSQALSGSLLNNLQLDYQLQWQLLAQSGLNTKECRLMLEQQPLTTFDIVVVSLGVNDVLSRLNSPQWVAQQQLLIKTLRERFNAKQILLTKIPPMAQFPALPQPLRWYLGARCQEFNNALVVALNGEKDLEIIDLSQQLLGKHMASDGFHPGKIIYHKWGQALATKINNFWA